MSSQPILAPNPMGFLDRFKKEKERQISDTPEQKAVVEHDHAHDHEGHDHAEHTHAAVAAPKAKETKKATGGVIVRPYTTEKIARLSTHGQYAFVVNPTATRTEVAQAVHTAYGVWPTSVNIQNVRGEEVHFGRRLGHRSPWKKAIVTVEKGTTLALHEGV